MGLIGGLWNPEVRARLQRLHHLLERAGPSPVSRAQRRRLRRRSGAIERAIITALAGSKREVRLGEICVLITDVLSEPVEPSSVKSCLSRCAQNPESPIERVARGRYRVRPA
jgi:hypothetical protein